MHPSSEVGRATPYERLDSVVRAHMRGAEAGSIDLVTAMTALLGRVAFADREFSAIERERVRQELGDVLGFGDVQIDALCAVLGAEIERLEEADVERYTDVLRERLDGLMRADVVKVLIELAACDRDIADTEVQIIRDVARRLMVDEALLEALLLRARRQTERPA